MTGYPELTCQQEYLDYYAHKTGAVWADVPAADLPAVYAGIDRCRVATLNRYCDEGYSDACAEVGRAIELAQLPTPDKVAPGFLDVLPGVTKERLGSIEAIAKTLHEGAGDLTNLVSGIVDAGTSIPRGVIKGLGLPDLPDLGAGAFSLVKVIAVAAIVVGGAYLATRSRN